jgi:hypothetical protein
MKTPAPLPAPVRLALALLALGCAAVTATAQSYSPNNPLDMARRDLVKAETDAVRFDPQSPERNALEGRAQQLRQQMAESILIYGAGVQKPGLYRPKPGLTVTEAIKLAGGTTPDADTRQVEIFLSSFRRSSTGQPTPQLTQLFINLSDLAPLPANHPPDTLPPPRIPGNNTGASFGYNYLLTSGDSIRVNSTEFRFEGGTPKDFLKAIDAHYLTAWQDLATIPPEAAEAKVPKIKTSLRQKIVARGGEEQIQSKPATALLDLYNALAADQPAMGKWKMPEPTTGTGARGGGGSGGGSRPVPRHPDLILPQPATRPDQSSTWLRDLAASSAQSFRVKALTLAPIPRSNWEGLVSDIPGVVSEAGRLLASELVKHGATAARDTGAGPDKLGILWNGRVQLSPGTGVLLVIGTPEYIEFVESFVAAKRTEAANTKNQ